AAAAIASRQETPYRGMSLAWAKVLAVTSPTRSPVNGAGPVPAATLCRSAGAAPTCCRHSAISGVSVSTCRRRSLLDRSAAVCPFCRRATLTPSEVSRHRVRLAFTASTLEPHRPGEFRGVPPGAHRVQHGAAWGFVRVLQGAAGAFQEDLQPVLGEVLHQILAPFDHGDGIVHGAVEVRGYDFGDGVQPVGVYVDEADVALARLVFAGGDEGGRCHPAAYAEGLAEALGQGGFPGAEFTGEHQQVAGAQQPGEAASEVAGRLGVGQGGLEGLGHCCPTTYTRGPRVPSRVTIS